MRRPTRVLYRPGNGRETAIVRNESHARDLYVGSTKDGPQMGLDQRFAKGLFCFGCVHHVTRFDCK